MKWSSNDTICLNWVPFKRSYARFFDKICISVRYRFEYDLTLVLSPTVTATVPVPLKNKLPICFSPQISREMGGKPMVLDGQFDDLLTLPSGL